MNRLCSHLFALGSIQLLHSNVRGGEALSTRLVCPTVANERDRKYLYSTADDASTRRDNQSTNSAFTFRGMLSALVHSDNPCSPSPAPTQSPALFADPELGGIYPEAPSQFSALSDALPSRPRALSRDVDKTEEGVGDGTDRVVLSYAFDENVQWLDLHCCNLPQVEGDDSLTATRIVFIICPMPRRASCCSSSRQNPERLSLGR